MGAKHQMDRMNAAVQLHKMHDEKLMNTRDLGLIEQLRKTERLAEFVAQVEDAKRDSIQEFYAYQPSGPEELKARESEISEAVHEMLDNIENGAHYGSLFAAKGVPHGSLKEKLVTEISKAADKEDEAKIIQAAGDNAQKAIKSLTEKVKSLKHLKKHPEHGMAPPGMLDQEQIEHARNGQ